MSAALHVDFISSIRPSRLPSEYDEVQSLFNRQALATKQRALEHGAADGLARDASLVGALPSSAEPLALLVPAAHVAAVIVPCLRALVGEWLYINNLPLRLPDALQVQPRPPQPAHPDGPASAPAAPRRRRTCLRASGSWILRSSTRATTRWPPACSRTAAPMCSLSRGAPPSTPAPLPVGARLSQHIVHSAYGSLQTLERPRPSADLQSSLRRWATTTQSTPTPQGWRPLRLAGEASPLPLSRPVHRAPRLLCPHRPRTPCGRFAKRAAADAGGGGSAPESQARLQAPLGRGWPSYVDQSRPVREAAPQGDARCQTSPEAPEAASSEDGASGQAGDARGLPGQEAGSAPSLGGGHEGSHADAGDGGEADACDADALARHDAECAELLEGLRARSVAEMEAEAHGRALGPMAGGARSAVIYVLNATALDLELRDHAGKRCRWPVPPPPAIPRGTEGVLVCESAGGMLGVVDGGCCYAAGPATRVRAGPRAFPPPPDRKSVV